MQSFFCLMLGRSSSSSTDTRLSAKYHGNVNPHQNNFENILAEILHHSSAPCSIWSHSSARQLRCLHASAIPPPAPPSRRQ